MDESANKRGGHNGHAAVAKAVEKLLQWAFRLGCYGVSAVLAAVTITGIWAGWPWPVAVLLVALSAVGVWAGRTLGGPCPIEVRPPELRKSNPSSETPGTP